MWPQNIEYNVLLHDREHAWRDNVPSEDNHFSFHVRAFEFTAVRNTIDFNLLVIMIRSTTCKPKSHSQFRPNIPICWTKNQLVTTQHDVAIQPNFLGWLGFDYVPMVHHLFSYKQHSGAASSQMWQLEVHQWNFRRGNDHGEFPIATPSVLPPALLLGGHAITRNRAKFVPNLSKLIEVQPPYTWKPVSHLQAQDSTPAAPELSRLLMLYNIWNSSYSFLEILGVNPAWPMTPRILRGLRKALQNV